MFLCIVLHLSPLILYASFYLYRATLKFIAYPGNNSADPVCVCDICVLWLDYRMD